MSWPSLHCLPLAISLSSPASSKKPGKKRQRSEQQQGLSPAKPEGGERGSSPVNPASPPLYPSTQHQRSPVSSSPIATPKLTPFLRCPTTVAGKSPKKRPKLRTSRNWGVTEVLPTSYKKWASMIRTGSILDIQSFKEVTNNSKLTNTIIQALEESGLLRLCTFPIYKQFDVGVVEFYLNAENNDDLIMSNIGGVPIIIGIDDVRSKFGLTGCENSVKNYDFDQLEFWKIVRKSDEEEFPCFSQNKKVLKLEFERLMDIIHKCIMGKTGSVDDLTPGTVGFMHMIWNEVKVDWGMYVFKRFQFFVTSARTNERKLINGLFAKRLGYGFIVGELLRDKHVKLGKPRNIGVCKYLFKTSSSSKRGTKRSLGSDEGSTGASSINSSAFLALVVERKRSKAKPRAILPSVSRTKAHGEEVSSAQMEILFHHCLFKEMIMMRLQGFYALLVMLNAMK